METKKVLNYVKGIRWPVKKIFKYAFLLLAIVAGLIILFAVMKVLFIYALYSFFLGKISAMFGLDMTLARLIAIFTTVATLLALPSIISFLLFGKNKKKVFIMVLVASVVWFLGLYYGTANVFFDRTTGKPAKYYMKTLEGFKFSSTEDFDPKFGVKFKPITPEIVKEYYFWQQTGTLENIPQVKAGEYFHIVTGEPIIWYSERPNGEIKLFSLPGYDPMTGQLLKPITPEIVMKITEKQPELSYGELNYDQTKIIKMIKKGKIDLDWYLKVKEKAFELDSGTDWGYAFNLFVEKIIFVPPSYTIVGICYRGVVGGNFLFEPGYILDLNGSKYEPVSHIGTIKKGDDHQISLSAGEKKRVFLIFEYISPEKLKTGAYTKRSTLIEFSLKTERAEPKKLIEVKIIPPLSPQISKDTVPMVKKEPQQTVEVKDIVISAYEFKRAGPKVICSMSVRNDSQNEAVISVMADWGRSFDHATLLYDDLGNQHVANEVVFGNESSKNVVDKKIPSKTYLNLSVIFKDVPPHASKATIRLALTLQFKDVVNDWGKRYYPILQDIPISKE